MKKLPVFITVGIVIIFVIFYVFNRTPEINKHPTLTASAQMPDFYLKNVEYYEEKERHEMSAFNLEKAIESIWKLEQDVDQESFQKLENVVKKLEQLHASILQDSVDMSEMRTTFENALNNLVHAELEISEMYAETNHMNEANIALKYAQLHVKNAMLFHHSLWMGDGEQLAIEKHVFEEMDSLIDNTSISPIDYALALDKIIKEVDQIIEKQKE